MKDIIIIGAGAAGLMTAATIIEGGASDYHIHLFEKNTSPGKKVIISGGGRCNVTTGVTDKKILATKYTRGWEFIEGAMGKFSPKKCREWFESHGVPLKIQEDMRIFPVSDDGRDIVGVFESIFEKYQDRITLYYGEGVSEVSLLSFSEGESLFDASHHGERCSQSEDDKNTTRKYQITTPKGSYEADILVITTGGNAYAHTGSTGDGYAFARALGHSVTPLGPSLSSFLTRESWLHALSGLVFEGARVSLFFSSHMDSLQNHEGKINKQNLLSEGKRDFFISLRNDKMEQKTLTGPLLLTHFGISGPLTFMVSSHLAFENIGRGSDRIIQFAPIAQMTREIWDTFLKISFSTHPKKLLINILSEKLSRRFAEAFIVNYFSHISDTFVGSLSRRDREDISKLLGDGIPLTLLERRPGDEFVTAGGVSTDELDPDTMESKIYKNLYFAGEILNVDGYTGGFSLQICWASGYSAGSNIVTRLFK